jgi:hypothetical protein
MVLFLGLISSHWLTRRRAYWGPGYGLPSHCARAASGGDVARFSEELADATKLVRAEKLKECADDFDAIHDVKGRCGWVLWTRSSQPPSSGRRSTSRWSAA